MIGVVAIGRNEGERLRVCLASALRAAKHVVYVDSGSTDDSVSMAKSMGVHVVELDLSTPFTAARSRNAGFEQLLEVAPDIELVQFVDGDCEIVDDWMPRAIFEISAATQAAVVCGRRRERFPNTSIYNALCDIEWNTPVGKARSCGGDALVRVKAFREVGGYDGRVIAGEEPEMCVRLRQAGWEILRIDTDMTLHDAAMTRFGQWWKRSLRSGHAFAEGFAMHGAPPERHNARQVRSVISWTVMLPLTIVLATVLFAFIAPRIAWVPSMLWLAYPMLALKIGMSKRMQNPTLPARDARLYGIFVVLGKFPQLLGMLRYFLSRARGRRSTLIEYKGAAVASAAK